jgi:flavorubredoxin
MKGDGWAVIVGDKMYPTRDLNFDDVEIGDVIKIGNTEFECATTTSLTEKDKYKTLINYNNILYTRKYFKKDNKFDSNIVESSDNLDKFAIVTVDERVIPLINELESDVRSNDGAGSSREGTPATT